MTEEIGDLSWGQRFESTIWLLDTIYQICGESVSETVETLLLNPSGFENPVESFTEVDRTGVVSFFIADKRTIFIEVEFFSQICNHFNGCTV